MGRTNKPERLLVRIPSGKIPMPIPARSIYQYISKLCSDIFSFIFVSDSMASFEKDLYLITFLSVLLWNSSDQICVN